MICYKNKKFIIKQKIQPLVSIIIPCYNVEQYIDQCLISILNNGYSNIEIICVDDRSTDSTVEHIKRLQKKNKNIQLYCNKLDHNIYGGGCRNIGLKYANGEYVYFCDSDDYILPGLFSSCIEKCEKYQLDICHFYHKILNDKTKSFSNQSDHVWQYNKKYLNCDSNNVFNKRNSSNIFMVFSSECWNKLYKYDFLKKTRAKFQQIRNSDDCSFHIKTLLHAKSILHINNEFYVHRQNTVNSVELAAIKGQNLNDIVLSLKECHNIVNKFNSDALMDQFYQWQLEILKWRNSIQDISLIIKDIIDFTKKHNRYKCDLKSFCENVSTKKQVELVINDIQSKDNFILNQFIQDKKIYTSIKKIDISVIYRCNHLVQFIANNHISNKDFELIQYLIDNDKQLKIDFLNVDVVESFIANHLNNSIFGYNNSPYFRIKTLNRTISHDLALIQCFHGTDPLLIKAFNLGLRYMLLSSTLPQEWVFVEAQKSENDKQFEWLKEYGITYVFKLICPENEHIFLQEALWHIGTHYTKMNRFVFVDGDVAYCQNDWLEKVQNTFDSGYELFQPHALSWRANELNSEKDLFNIQQNNLVFSVSSNIIKGNITYVCGHTGYDRAMTKKYYSKIRGLYATTCSGFDYTFWCNTLGEQAVKSAKLGYQNFDCEEMRNYRCDDISKIGCSNLICFHNFHGSIKSRNHDLKLDLSRKYNVNFGDDVIFDLHESDLPKINYSKSYMKQYIQEYSKIWMV